MELTDLRKLFVHELRDLHNAETQILEALPEMIEQSHDRDLRSAFEKHLKETEEQVDRLERIFDELGEKVNSHRCKGMEGLLEEGEDMLSEDADKDVRDAAIIASAQKVEHYEISGYGTALAHAQLLDEDTAARLLEETLEEEKEADRKLTSIAERGVNVKAHRGGS